MVNFQPQLCLSCCWLKLEECIWEKPFCICLCSYSLEHLQLAAYWPDHFALICCDNFYVLMLSINDYCQYISIHLYFINTIKNPPCCPSFSVCIVQYHHLYLRMCVYIIRQIFNCFTGTDLWVCDSKC